MRRPDPIGLVLRAAPEHHVVRRVRGRWERGLGGLGVRRRRLAGVGRLDLRMRYPYERSVWLRPEQLDDIRYTKSLLQDGDVFVDCGANIGLWALAGAAAVGAHGRVVAIEPAPEVFARLVHHVELNGLGERMTLECCALADRSGTLHFDAGDEFHNIGHVIDDPAAAASTATIEVAAKRLDDIAPDRVDAIKIDVEGHELQVLRGARELLRRARPWIIVEYNRDELDTDRLGDWPVHAWLASEGWACHRLAPGEQPLSGDWRRRRGLGHMNLLYRPVAAQ